MPFWTVIIALFTVPSLQVSIEETKSKSPLLYETWQWHGTSGGSWPWADTLSEMFRGADRTSCSPTCNDSFTLKGLLKKKKKTTSKKGRQTFRTAFLLCTKPLHSSLLITRILVRGECHFQNIRQFILFDSHFFFPTEAKKTGDYCCLFLPDKYQDGKCDTSPIKAENNRQKMCWHIWTS